MASVDYDGGIGGKFRKRPFRRAQSTPYDRPQTANRRLNPNPNPNSNGWISKIVDPASRIIARGASNFFASVFQKRLTAPPPQPPEENLCSRNKAPEAVLNNMLVQKPSGDLLDQGVNAGEDEANHHVTYGIQQETLSSTNRFSEVEQLLKKKTFTKAEFDRLMDLLRSRTVESSTSNLLVDYENKEDATVTPQVKHNGHLDIEPSTSQPGVCYRSKGKAVVSEHDGGKSSTLRGIITNSPANSHIPEEEAVSPMEIAKAFMGSRPTKVSPSSLSVHSQIIQDDATLTTVPYANKALSALVSARPTVHFSGMTEYSESGYMTPRPRGRSAVYRMSRSPYFKVHQTPNIRGGRSLMNGLVSSSASSSLGQQKVMLSSGKQVLKRGSSVLDSDFGSVGPIRRIREKSYFMSPFTERRTSPLGNLPPSLATPRDQDVNQRPSTSTKKSFASVPPVPRQSTEMARKIIQELEKLVPSPSEKSSEKKGSGDIVVVADSPVRGLRNSISPKQDSIKGNGPSDAKATHDIVGMENLVSSASDVKPSKKIAEIAISGSAAVPLKDESAFQITMDKESPELGANKYSTASTSGLFTTENGKLSEKSAAYPIKSMLAPSSMFKGETDVKASDGPSAEKGVDSMFYAAPSIPSFADRSVPKKEIPSPASKLAITTAEPASLKVDPSATLTPGNIPQNPSSDEGGKGQKADDLYKSFGNTTSSGLSTSTSSALFAFGGLTGPNQNNGSLTSTSSSLPVSVAVMPLFQFSSGTSTGFPISVPLFGDKSGTGDLGRKSTEPSPDTISSSITPGASNLFSNPNITSSAPATSSLFSSIGGSSSAHAPSSALSSPVNGIFNFSASAQSSTPGSSLATNSISNSGSGAMSFPTFGLNSSSSPSFGTSLFGSNSGFSFTASNPFSSATIPSFAPSVSTLPSTGFSFTAPSSTSSNLTSSVGASSGPVFSFSAQPVISSGLPGTDQMNVEDSSMAEDSIQTAPPPLSVPSFSTSTFQFNAPAANSGASPIFQFSSQPNSTVPQNPSPFQAGGSFEFSGGGSFSLGSGGGGGDKAGRRIIRVRRDKRGGK